MDVKSDGLQRARARESGCADRREEGVDVAGAGTRTQISELSGSSQTAREELTTTSLVGWRDRHCETTRVRSVRAVTARERLRPSHRSRASRTDSTLARPSSLLLARSPASEQRDRRPHRRRVRSSPCRPTRESSRIAVGRCWPCLSRCRSPTAASGLAVILRQPVARLVEPELSSPCDARVACRSAGNAGHS